MLLTQSFNSVNEIDGDFVPALEQLLAQYIPSFQSLQDYEKNAAKDNLFSYYLFFGKKTNAPIGFAQVEFEKKQPIKQSLIERYVKKSQVHFYKTAKWHIPGAHNEGIIFDPRYAHEASQATSDLFKQLMQRTDILKQDLTYSHKEASLDAQFVNENISKHHLFQIDFLLKNTDSYQSYLNKLEKNDQTKLKLAWKNVQQKLNYNIGDYENLKECFAYKSNGAAQYKTIKKDEKVLSYLQETAKTHFLTLETNDAVKALIIVIEGHAGNIFYDLLITCPNLTEEIYHQMSIMKFYEIASSKRLHFLGDINDTNSFKSQGFILKEKIQIHSTKN